jgi:hypothetical protein
MQLTIQVKCEIVYSEDDGVEQVELLIPRCIPGEWGCICLDITSAQLHGQYLDTVLNSDKDIGPALERGFRKQELELEQSMKEE